MDECPHCGGREIGIFGGYYYCCSDGCRRLLFPVDLEEREKEKIKLDPLAPAEMQSLV